MAALSDPKRCIVPADLRSYQLRIIKEVEAGNGVVLLPTGAGKTVIAGELIRQKNNARLAGVGKTLFLVPTCNLVEQQASFLEAYTNLETGKYFGGERLPAETFRIIVSTPKAFQIAQAKSPQLLGWKVFSFVVFDEVHHALKNHPYRRLGLDLGRFSDSAAARTGRPPHVLGLTASISYAVEENKVRASIETLMRELRMRVLATASAQELQESGYHANVAVPEIAAPIDLAAYTAMPSLTDANATCDGTLVPVAERKPHLLLPTFWARVRKGEVSRFAKDLLDALREREVAATAELGADNFRSPVGPPGSGPGVKQKLADWGDYASKAAGRQPTASRGRALLEELEQWYEALRILVASWEENREGALLFLEMMLPHDICGASSGHVAWFFQRHPVAQAHVRLEQLKEVLYAKHDASFRGIVFVQQRVTTHIIAHFLRSDPDLSEIFRCAPLYAVTTPATPTLSVTKAESRDTVRQFGAGEVNLLIATVVAEEGMDVPAANCVIRYDPVLNAVSHVQGRGRARQTDSSFVVLAERTDRSTAVLQDVEQLQLRVASGFRADEELTTGALAARREKERQAQEARERGAKEVVLRPADENTALGNLNLYCKKTKIELEETCDGDEVTLLYSSCLRRVVGRGRHMQKKLAKRLAAADLLVKLGKCEGCL